MSTTMLELFEAARRVSVPLVAIHTADQAHTTALLADTAARIPAGGHFPVVRWDAARGLTGANKPGAEAIGRVGIKPADTVGFVEAMLAAQLLPQSVIVVAHNALRQLQSQEPGATAAAIQAVANLRDTFKLNSRMLVLLGPHVTLPPELSHDVVILTHELPDLQALGQVVERLYKVTTPPLTLPTADVQAQAVEAISGLSDFEAEQVVAMSLTSDGVDLPSLWERKRVAIEQTPGLSVYRGTETLDSLRGLASVKQRLRAHIHAKTPLGVVVWIDEGADVFSNVEQDTSGVKTDQQRQLLVDMEQYNWRGIIGVGVPGSGKSAVARGFGNEAGIPTIQVDFGGMESKYVGESEGNLRRALDVIKAVGNGHAFFVLTCNTLRGIRPQFQRRFRRGIFFFDLPSAEEREAIWQLYLTRYDLDAAQPQPDDAGWTGAEIRECCESAWDTGTSLLEAAQFIVPVSRSRATEIEAMRKEAHGRFLDASRSGDYRYEAEPMDRAVRAIALPKGVMQMQES